MEQRRSTWRAEDLERKARMVRDALDKLLSVTSRRSVLAELHRRAEETNTPDGFPRSSMSAAPALVRPSSAAALRTHPEDPMRRSKGHGFSEDTSVEEAVLTLLDDSCTTCEGLGYVAHGEGDDRTLVTCRVCHGSGRLLVDPIGEAIEDIFTRLVEMSGHAVVIHRKVQYVLNARDSVRSERDPYFCDGCHRPTYGGKGDPIRDGLCGTCATAWYEWKKKPGNDTGDKGADKARFCLAHKRHEGHIESACLKCAELAQRADDSWRVEQVAELQRRGALPPDRRVS